MSITDEPKFEIVEIPIVNDSSQISVSNYSGEVIRILDLGTHKSLVLTTDVAKALVEKLRKTLEDE